MQISKGGGVWTCSYGSTVLDLDVDKVWIHNNQADGSTGNKNDKRTKKNEVGGQDFHSDNGGDGTLLMINANETQWLDENTNKMYKPGEVDAEIRNLTNKEQNGNTSRGIQIYHNASRRGGGLAADGTFVFGEKQNVSRVTAELDISKVWDDSIPIKDRKPVIIRAGVENNGKTAVIRDLELDGKEDPQTDEDAIHENAGSDNEWTGGFNLPVTVDTEAGERITVFYIEGPDGTKYDLSKKAHIDALAAAVGDGKGFTLASDAKLTFTELVKTDNGYEETGEYRFYPGEVQVEDLDLTIKNVTRVNAQGIKEDVLSVSFTKIPLKAPLRNKAPEKPEIEKYVNQAVHSDIDLDEVFTYDILAYVTDDADKVTITDKLVDDLEFVEADTIKVSDLGLDSNNDPIQSNHKPTYNVKAEKVNDYASVKEAGKDIPKKDGVSVTTDGGKLTVVLDDVVNKETGDRENHTVENLRGHWVKVSFKAQIKKALQDRIKAGEEPKDVLKYVEIKDGETYKPEDSIYKDENRPEPNVGNAPVESKENHKGVANTASYEIEVANEAAYKDESNTVTVKPEEPELEKYVNQAVHKNIEVGEVFTYDIVGYISKDADKVVFEDELESCLELVNVEDIKIASLDSNNHKPTNDVGGKEINKDASVAKAGADIKSKDGVTVKADEKGSMLTVTIDDDVKVDEDTGAIERKYGTVLGLRKKYVKITFQAQIKEELQAKIMSGEMSIAELLAKGETIKGDENDPVLSEEEHNGIPNDATMKIVVADKGKFDVFSNVVTVKPRGPEIEKYVNQAVHKDIKLKEEFTYDIIAYVTKDADKVVITDKLDAQLQFVSKSDEIKVVDLGTTNNHKVTNDINAKQVNKDASVAESGKDIDKKKVSIEGDTLTVTLEDDTVKALRGHWVKITFDAKIKDGLKVSDLDYTKKDANAVEDRAEPNKGNAPVESDESHEGVPNKASYTIGVTNEADIVEEKYKDESNTVTVKPEEPEIEKYVNQAVHDFIDIDESFIYDIIAYVTNDAEKVIITDKLDSQLQFVSKDSEIKVVDLGTTNNHKVTNDINAKQVNKDASVAESGKDIDNKTVNIEGDTLTVTLYDLETVKALRGHWVKITFDAKIKDGLKVNDLKYTMIDADEVEKRAEPNKGNAPVESDESHEGVPNKAAYTIGVTNEAGKIEDKHKDESNTVTVKPDKFEVEISKQDLEGAELPGAKIKILDDKGKEVDSWTSEDKPHKLKLKEGRYQLIEVVAPDGFNRVTTIIGFEVDEEGNVTVLNAQEVDNGGAIKVIDLNHLILTDAPAPTFDKTVNGGKDLEISSRDEIFKYNIAVKTSYVPEKKFVITDDVPEQIEILGLDNVSITVNGVKLSDDIVKSITAINGNKLTVTPTLEMMKEWGPFSMDLEFACKFKANAKIKAGESIKNVAMLELDNVELSNEGGDNEAEVLPAFEDENPVGAETGDNTVISIWIALMLLTAAAVSAFVIRRRRSDR